MTNKELVSEKDQDQPTQDLEWHRPTLLRLSVSLDTRDAGGSQGDGEFGTIFDGQV